MTRAWCLLGIRPGRPGQLTSSAVTCPPTPSRTPPSVRPVTSRPWRRTGSQRRRSTPLRGRTPRGNPSPRDDGAADDRCKQGLTWIGTVGSGGPEVRVRAVRPDLPLPLPVRCGNQAGHRARRCRSDLGAEVGSGSESEDPAVRGHQPVATAIPGGGDPDRCSDRPFVRLTSAELVKLGLRQSRDLMVRSQRLETRRRSMLEVDFCFTRSTGVGKGDGQTHFGLECLGIVLASKLSQGRQAALTKRSDLFPPLHPAQLQRQLHVGSRGLHAGCAVLLHHPPGELLQLPENPVGVVRLRNLHLASLDDLAYRPAYPRAAIPIRSFDPVFFLWSVHIHRLRLSAATSP